jgi:hypothetical protein
MEAVLERALDWRSFHDERSLDYPVREVLPPTVPRRKRSWQAHKQRLDQGREGACVGFGWTAELQAQPSVVGGPGGQIAGQTAQYFATWVYRQAQQVDDWPGEDYEGTSVLAGAKVVQGQGFIDQYRWAFSIDDVLDALVEIGPVVLGIPWFESMYETRPSGLVEVDGRLVGGHCITLTGYHPRMRLRGEGWTRRFEVCRWRNSWGEMYGRKGDGYILVEDLERLLWGRYGGEACIPIDRHVKARAA